MDLPQELFRRGLLKTNLINALNVYIENSNYLKEIGLTKKNKPLSMWEDVLNSKDISTGTVNSFLTNKFSSLFKDAFDRLSEELSALLPLSEGGGLIEWTEFRARFNSPPIKFRSELYRHERKDLIFYLRIIANPKAEDSAYFRQEIGLLSEKYPMDPTFANYGIHPSFTTGPGRAVISVNSIAWDLERIIRSIGASGGSIFPDFSAFLLKPRIERIKEMLTDILQIPRRIDERKRQERIANEEKGNVVNENAAS